MKLKLRDLFFLFAYIQFMFVNNVSAGTFFNLKKHSEKENSKSSIFSSSNQLFKNEYEYNQNIQLSKNNNFSFLNNFIPFANKFSEYLPFIPLIFGIINGYLYKFFIFVFILKLAGKKISLLNTLYYYLIPYCMIINYFIVALYLIPNFLATIFYHLSQLISLLYNNIFTSNNTFESDSIMHNIIQIILISFGFVSTLMFLNYINKKAGASKTKNSKIHTFLKIAFIIICYTSLDFSCIQSILLKPHKLQTNIFEDFFETIFSFINYFSFLTTLFMLIAGLLKIAILYYGTNLLFKFTTKTFENSLNENFN